MPPPNETPNLVPVALRPRIHGRIRNLTKPKHWYMAIAEVIKNAMDSIEDSGRSGRIEVELYRGADLAAQGGLLGPIQSVTVRDNGIGFNDINFDSFSTPDSEYKSSRGGKGLGRFICLQVFSKIEVTSIYKNGKGWERRDFVLQCETPELAQAVKNVEDSVFETEVRLKGLRDEFNSYAAVEFEKLVAWLTEHFLPALVEKPTWLEALVIRDGNQEKDLTHLIQGGAIWSEPFRINNYDFNSSCYAIQSPNSTDQVRLVAVGRVVDANTRDLEHYLPHVGSVNDDSSHVVLVRSPFFNEHVNDARNGVSFCDDDEETALFGITAAQFREALGGALKGKLGERVNKANDALIKRIEDIVQKEAPHYRPLLRGYFISKEFETLSASARLEEILASIDSYRRRETLSLKRESRRLAKLQAESADYMEGARQLAKQIEAQKQVALAEYVSLRKIVLERLQQLLEVKGDGHAHREEAIHNLVFPQRTNSESSPGTEHQLWILDERLESHTYLASDEPMDGKLGDRPDLLIALDHAGAFASDPAPKAKGYERIALVEFKRALKDITTVPIDDLPHRQMMRYAHDISKGKAIHLGSGRKITTSSDVRFYLYAICEVSKEFLERLIREDEFTPSPTSDGAFAVKNKGQYYIEYISLPKLLEDAKTRNQAFFRKLGLEM